MMIYEVLKIRDFNKLLRLLFATPQQLLRDPLWGRDPPVGNHCFRVIAFTDAHIHTTSVTQRNVLKATVPHRMV